MHVRGREGVCKAGALLVVSVLVSFAIDGVIKGRTLDALGEAGVLVGTEDWFGPEWLRTGRAGLPPSEINSLQPFFPLLCRLHQKCQRYSELFRFFLLLPLETVSLKRIRLK